MKLTIEGGRMLPEWVLEFLGMGKGPDLRGCFISCVRVRSLTEV